MNDQLLIAFARGVLKILEMDLRDSDREIAMIIAQAERLRLIVGWSWSGPVVAE